LAKKVALIRCVRRWHRRRPRCTMGAAGRQRASGLCLLRPIDSPSIIPKDTRRCLKRHVGAARSIFGWSTLDTGDYLIDDEVLVERKTIGDFVASLVDGRLFPQTARLAHSRYRSLLMIEGPRPPSMSDVHPHAIEGAVVSLAAMWRLPVLHSSEPEHSLLILRLLADQATRSHQPVLRRFDRKPKRHASKRLFLLQGLPGVGPALAARLLDHFGSIERVVSADVSALAEVRGIGPRKAALIRELVR
jgi:DNA excision repair protein ERCC-4